MIGSRVSCLAVAVTSVIAVGGCNSRQTVIDASVPTAPSSVGVPTISGSELVSVIVDPSAVFTGSSTNGEVLLSFPAPASGVAVSLTSSSPTAFLPASITVPAGANTGRFAIQTSALAPDSEVAISARAGARTAQTTLGLWTRTVPYVASWTDRGNGERLRVHRVTPRGSWRLGGFTDVAVVSATEGTVSYDLLFRAPRGTRLAPGVYENAQSRFVSPTDPNRPELGLFVIASSGTVFPECFAPQPSRFEVKDVDFASDGRVRRFAVTFEQRCGQAVITGELNVSGAAPF